MERAYELYFIKVSAVVHRSRRVPFMGFQMCENLKFSLLAATIVLSREDTGLMTHLPFLANLGFEGLLVIRYAYGKRSYMLRYFMN